MSFSLTQINKNKTRSQYTKEDIRHLFGAIKGIEILTNNVEEALNYYIRYRLTMRKLSTFSVDTLTKMVVELLEKCCDSSFDALTRQDIVSNEKSILKQIKYAVLSGATKHIYYESSYNIVDTSRLRQTILPCNRKVNKTNTNKEAELIKKYFEDLRV